MATITRVQLAIFNDIKDGQFFAISIIPALVIIVFANPNDWVVFTVQLLATTDRPTSLTPQQHRFISYRTYLSVTPFQTDNKS